MKSILPCRIYFVHTENIKQSNNKTIAKMQIFAIVNWQLHIVEKCEISFSTVISTEFIIVAS